MKHVFKSCWFSRIGLLALLAVALQGCGGGGGGTPPTWTVSGTVSGLTSDVVLQLNGGNDSTVTSDGNFTFNTTLSNGASYSVTVLVHPAGQTCRVSNASGTATANVSVSVECRTNVDPTGYYENTGTTVGDGSGGTLDLTDFQAMIHNNRFMAMSVTAGLIYDGQLILFGDEYTGTVSVYRHGELQYSGVPVSGSFIGATMSGTFAGTDEGAGDFSLNFSITNGPDHELTYSRISAGTPRTSAVGDLTNEMQIYFSITGGMVSDPPISGGNFSNCWFPNGRLSLISDTSLASVTTPLSDCDNPLMRTLNAGSYTGFVTLRSDSSVDDVLVFVVTSDSGQFAIGGDFR